MSCWRMKRKPFAVSLHVPSLPTHNSVCGSWHLQPEITISRFGIGPRQQVKSRLARRRGGVLKNAEYRQHYRVLLGRLREVRFEAGLTQLQAARRLSKPQSFISKVESGERRVGNPRPISNRASGCQRDLKLDPTRGASQAPGTTLSIAYELVQPAEDCRNPDKLTNNRCDLDRFPQRENH